MAVNIECELWPVTPSELQKFDEVATKELNNLAVLQGNVTFREGQMVQTAIEGKSVKQTSTALDISVRTVENHRSSLLKRTNLPPDRHTMAGAVNVLCHSGLTECMGSLAEGEGSEVDPPFSVALSPKAAIFVKYAALGYSANATTDETGVTLARGELRGIILDAGAVALPGLIRNFYRGGLFIPKSQLVVKESKEAGED